MKLLLVLAYVLSHSYVNGQEQCLNIPSLSAIENDFRSAVNASDQAGNGTFNLGDVYFNCITYASSDGSTFREMTITASYQVEDGTFLGRALYACVNVGGSIVWRSDDVVLKTGSATNGTERCSNCRAVMSQTTCTVCSDDCGQGKLNYDCSGCVCNDGYTGLTCDTDINECDIDPSVCEGGGMCTNNVGGFSCSCPVPCMGDCNACCSSPCTRGGTCSSTGGDDFSCQCPPGYTGKRCQVFQGGCLSSPCMNGALCNTVGLSVDQYSCSCPVGFTGVNCEEKIDYCASGPCKHQSWCTNNPSGYTCTCLHGFTGSDCGQPLLTCRSNPMACGANGECISRNVDRLIVQFCSCNPGYTGESCNTVADNCTNNMDPCFHNSTCIPTSGGNSNFSFSCSCIDNWTGFYCTECSLQCNEDQQPDARCTRCICNEPNTDEMCSPPTHDPGANEGDNSDDATAAIAGAVVGGVVAIGFAVVMVTIGIYFIKKSSKTTSQGVVASDTWMNSQFNSDPFSHANDSSIPRFSGSILGPKSAFTSAHTETQLIMTQTEVSGYGDTNDS